MYHVTAVIVVGTPILIIFLAARELWKKQSALERLKEIKRELDDDRGRENAYELYWEAMHLIDRFGILPTNFGYSGPECGFEALRAAAINSESTVARRSLRVAAECRRDLARKLPLPGRDHFCEKTALTESLRIARSRYASAIRKVRLLKSSGP